ncbi:PEP-CTERM sorting domain-containing protein [Schlesneria sp. T3-172]|uniref:PEP-CTERM sorting domain-containing protein n=1 Tax=Schlesneria sphaerica TaxID=3373610 RepID=UPI0037CC695B
MVSGLIRSFLTLAAIGILVSTAQAAVIEVTNRSDLGANDFVDWSQLGPVDFSSPITLPYDVTSNSGSTATLSKPSGVIYADVQTPGGPWGGNFAPGDALLYNGPQFGIDSSPLTIAFATPVYGVGAQIGVNVVTSSDYLFDATIRAYRADNSLLFEHVFKDLVMNNKADNSANFIGIRSSTGEIASIEISVPASTSYGTNDFAINQLDINSVPEPSTFALAGLGGLGFAVRAVRRRRAATV